MKNRLKYTKSLLFALGLLLFLATACTEDDENSIFTPPAEEEVTDEIDLYVNEHMLKEHGTAVRWRWQAWFIDDDRQATPIKREFVIPTTDLVEYLWFEPYKVIGGGGEKLIKELFPPELVYIGSYIYKDDGTRLLGYAEGGARITLLNLNSYDLQNETWLTDPTRGGILATVHHEFSHIVHQNYGIPAGFNTISEKYNGAGWSNGVTLSDAIKLGMVRNYGTANEYEDFCEIICHFLTLPADVFQETFIDQQSYDGITDVDEITEIRELNEGRLKIQQKLTLIEDFYKNRFNIDLVALRDTMANRINYVLTNNKIPE